MKRIHIEHFYGYGENAYYIYVARDDADYWRSRLDSLGIFQTIHDETRKYPNGHDAVFLCYVSARAEKSDIERFEALADTE